MLAKSGIISSATDPTVLSHKPIYAAALVFVCVFALLVFLVLTFIGLLIGYSIKCKHEEPEVEEEFFH